MNLTPFVFNKSVPIFCKVVHRCHLHYKQKSGVGLGEVDIKLARNERLTISPLTWTNNMWWVGVRNTASVEEIASFAKSEGNHGRVDIKLATEQERLTMAPQPLSKHALVERRRGTSIGNIAA